ncbi:ABC transporter substrate-binding protein [Georgenia halophila]|uniref:ABC transporter substrate-binding protein n=1 Tax=Georgenia halophila TaxID=620889 RepID=A0ABP8KTI3_9MICO
MEPKTIGLRGRARRLVAVAAALLLASFALASCSGGSASGSGDGAAAGGETLTIASVVDNNSFDRADLEIGHRVHYWMPVYDTLLVLDENAEPQPNLVTEWSYNDDATVLNLHLREGVEFTDGTPFDGAAVQANLEHLANGTGQNSYMAASIEEVEVVSDTEVNLHLSQPDPGLIGYLAVVGGAMASPKALEASSGPVGSGPYVLEAGRTTTGSQYTFVRNEDYWNAEAFPYEEIVVKPFQDETARLNALLAGQVDVGQIDTTAIEQAEGAGLEVTRNPVDWQGLFIADRDGQAVPALGDVRVRRAINLAIDGQSILDNLLLGEGELTDQPFNPLSEAYVPELDSYYSHDVEEARRLMAEAGYEDGFTVTMPQLQSFANYSPIISEQLSQLNIDVKWEQVSADASISEILSGRFPMFFFSLGSQSAWQDLRKFAFPESPWNTAKVENQELSALLDRVLEVPLEEQPAAMQEANRWLVENAWFAPFYRVNMLVANQTSVDVQLQPWNVVPWIRDFAPAS